MLQSIQLIKFTRLKNILQIVISFNKKIRKKLKLNNKIFDLLMIFLSKTRIKSIQMLIYSLKDPRAFLLVQIHSTNHYLDSSKKELFRAKIATLWSEAKQCCLGFILIINLPEIMYSTPTLNQIKWYTKVFKISKPNSPKLRLNFIASLILLLSHILSKLNQIIIFILKIKYILKRAHK